jgi:peptide/nickel transport system substrate-binding protein
MQKGGRGASVLHGRSGPHRPDGHPLASRTALFAFCILHFALTACHRTDGPANPDVITVAARVGPNSLHPLKANDEGTTRVAALVYESLMEIGEDLRAVPGLAERLEMRDPLTYVAHLRHGVRFHDGRELTAADVVFTFSRFLDPAFISPYKGAFTVMAGVKALDDYTVEFTLKEPFAAFPFANLVPIDIVPAHVDEASLTRFPIGTGPYRFVRYDVDDKVELAAFDGYWEGRPDNAGVVMKIIPDDTMRGLELRKGSADVIMNDIVPDIAYQLERSGDVRTVRSPGLDFSYLGFNMRDPVVSDQRVRHAIGYAIDRDAITKYLRRDLARPATGLIPPQAWAYEPDIFTFSYDPARAMRLLEEAGYPDPDGPDGPLPRLTVSLKISTNEEVRLQSTVIQENLRRVGIHLDLQSYEFATVFADILKGNFQMMSLIWVGGAVIDPDILRRVFHSTQVPPVGFNRGYYSNPEVDRLIDLATAALTEPERKGYYAAAQKIIAEEAPYIPIWNRVNVLLARHDLDGLRMTATAHFATLKDVKRVAR